MQNNFFFLGSYSNIYKKPLKTSEVTSQIIYGEKFKILSKNKNWIKIKTLFDNYEGFIKNSNYIAKFSPNYKVYKIKARIFKKPGIKTNKWLPLASIGTAGRTTLASSSGALVDWLNGDWGTFFVLTTIMVIPSLICLWMIKNKIKIGAK